MACERETKRLTMRYFVLNPWKNTPYGEASRFAIKTYSQEIRKENPQLSDDLDEWLLDIARHIIRCKHRADPELPLEDKVEIIEDGWEAEHNPTPTPGPPKVEIAYDDDGSPVYKPASMPGPAKEGKEGDGLVREKPAQQHGFKVGDVVAVLGKYPARITRLYEGRDNNPYIEVQYRGDRKKLCAGWGLHQITPAHRCPDYGWKNRADGVEDKETVFFIAQPGNLLEPFGTCSEEPYPVGTWIKTGTVYEPKMYIITSVLGEIELDYRCHSQVFPYSRTVTPSSITEARLPEHEVCKDCGCAYVLPKEGG